MCGIAGIYSVQETVAPRIIQKMMNTLGHRGRDDEGYLAVDLEGNETYPLTGSQSKVKGPRIEDLNKSVRLFLGHRRLSIIDLSSAGHQPMSNEDESLWIVYNGEIYNYVEIGEELKTLGHRLRSKTDTEVILHAYEEWGMGCLNHFNGMWAFVIVDLKAKRIFCSRDRAGVKPFYYLYDGKQFCFASEIKALLELNRFDIKPNEQIIADYLFSGLLDHTNETFFKNIYQLRAGEYLLFEDKKLTIRSYWDIETNEIHFSRDDDYAERFYELLKDSIRLRLRTDVPIGSCLSGGLDSSSIVCLANRLMFNGQNIDPKLVGERQKTFSSCFEDLAYDERKFIELIIHRTGAEKNYVFPKAEALFEEIMKLIWHQDEPFGSSSIFAQWNVMRLAKERGVIVLLDGQGGDELLAGYPTSFYFLIRQILKSGNMKHLFKEINAFRKSGIALPDRFAARMIDAILPDLFKILGQKCLQKKIDWAEEGFHKRYFRSISKPKRFEHDLNNYLYQIFRSTTLPGLLHYEDRNSMAFSLETRLPFLDYRLVEYAFTLPLGQKINGGVTKVVLRNAMKDLLPEEIKNRRDKMGFVTPEGIWFRTDLKDRIYQIIGSKSFKERGLFNISKVKKVLDNHCDGKINNSSVIWRLVNLELWFRIFVDQKPWAESWENGRDL